MDDTQLVRLCKTGEKEAFSSLIDKYYKNLYRFAFENLQSHHDADEICQETFLRALKDINTIREDGSFKGWIFTIAQNLIRKHFKRNNRQINYDWDGEIMDAEKFKVEQTEPSDDLFTKEKKFIIQKELLSIPEELRNVAVLVIIEDFSQKQASGILNCSEASISRRLQAAKNLLRAKLKGLI